MLVVPSLVVAQTAPAIPPSVSTPDKVETRIGTLNFKDGAPDAATSAKVYDHLVGDATTDQRAEPKKEPLIPSTMVCRVDERPKERRHGGQL
jgi:hypothetical protein